MPYEQTQARIHLKPFLARLEQLPEDAPDAAAFCLPLRMQLRSLLRLTAQHYGAAAAPDAEAFRALRRAYAGALAAAASLWAEPAPGRTVLLLRTLLRELEPWLTEDLQNLQAAEQAAKLAPSLPLPELLGRCPAGQPAPAAADGSLLLQLSAGEDDALMGGRSRRFPIQWKEHGVLRRGLFTPAQPLSVEGLVEQAVARWVPAKLRRECGDFFRALAACYAFTDRSERLESLPQRMEALPWAELGLSPRRAAALLARQELRRAYFYVQLETQRLLTIVREEEAGGTVRGQRIDLRSVAMYGIAAELGVPELLIRAVPARAELEGRLCEGVLLEAARGVDFKQIRPGTALASLPAAALRAVFDTEGLRDLADLQILDYLCLNQDRSIRNLFFCFDDPESDHPSFTGVQGIDNDLAFGTLVPPADQPLRRLPALRDLRVLSSSMAAALGQPDLAERIAGQMHRSGLRPEEIRAAHRRLELLRQRLAEGSLEPVADGSWGKGRYRLEHLAAGAENSSLFRLFRDQFVDHLAELAAKAPGTPGQYLPLEQSAFPPGLRVEAFGPRALRAAALERAQRRVRLEWIAPTLPEDSPPAPWAEPLPPRAAAFARLRLAQAGLETVEGPALQEQSALILCLHRLTRLACSPRRNAVTAALLAPDALRRQTQGLLQSPAFRAAAALPEQELRALAGAGDGWLLAERYLSALARLQPEAAEPEASVPAAT